MAGPVPRAQNPIVPLNAAGFFKERPDYAKHAAGQAPGAIIVSCSDSRVDPGVIFGAEPGELFGVRLVAATVPANGWLAELDSAVEAIGYAVRHLGVRRIFVMGHSGCGGAKNLHDTHGHSNDAKRLAIIGKEICCDIHAAMRDAGEAERLATLTQALVLQSLKNITTHGFYKECAEKIELYGLYCDIAGAQVLAYDAVKETFVQPEKMYLPVVDVAGLDDLPRDFVQGRVAEVAETVRAKSA